ncbi:uncharacterized protein LOC131950786 [Physella acuta]|uniref:uncharacterized protein LOC131950786 n=1 Tax=Physella acuta TaxID=109671 RepID=UPI0027DB7083|nr:uncharacterized protein LOC131950786 [Physella acuta]
MYFSPVIFNGTRKNRAPDSFVGGVHLNAINGSTDSTPFSPFSSGYSGQSQSYGGHFSFSMEDTYRYRSQDSSNARYESSSPKKSPTYVITDDVKPATERPIFYSQIIPRNNDDFLNGNSGLSTSEEEPGRNSLDLEENPHFHPVFEDLLRSLEELDQSRGHVTQHDLEYDEDRPSALTLSDLNITNNEVRTPASISDESDVSNTLAPQAAKSYKSVRRYHLSDYTNTERTLQLMQKMKEGKKMAPS